MSVCNLKNTRTWQSGRQVQESCADSVCMCLVDKQKSWEIPLVSLPYLCNSLGLWSRKYFLKK